MIQVVRGAFEPPENDLDQQVFQVDAAPLLRFGQPRICSPNLVPFFSRSQLLPEPGRRDVARLFILPRFLRYHFKTKSSSFSLSIGGPALLRLMLRALAAQITVPLRMTAFLGTMIIPSLM